MRFVRHAMRKDLRRHAKDPMAVALWLGIPLLIGGLVTFAFGDVASAPPRAKVLIVDQDESVASTLFKGLLAREELKVLETEVVSLDAGTARIKKGDGSALLVIPEGFQTGVLKDEPTELRLTTNPAQSVLPQITAQMLQTFVDLVFYAQRILGDELRTIAEESGDFQEAPDDATVARISTSANGVMRRAQRYLAPPVLRIATSVDKSAGKGKGSSVNLAALFLPGIVLMALFFLATGVSEDVWRERDQGTLRRAVSSPGGVGALFGGKILAGMVVAAVISLLLLVLGMGYLGMSFRVLPIAVVWCTVTAGVLLIAMCFIQTLASSQRAGQIFTNAVSFPLLMLGGSFFPSELMPKWLAAVGRYTPNGWSLEYLKDLLLGRGSASSLLFGFTLLVVAGAALYLLTVQRIRAFARAS